MGSGRKISIKNVGLVGNMKAEASLHAIIPSDENPQAQTNKTVRRTIDGQLHETNYFVLSENSPYTADTLLYCINLQDLSANRDTYNDRAANLPKNIPIQIVGMNAFLSKSADEMQQLESLQMLLIKHSVRFVPRPICIYIRAHKDDFDLNTLLENAPRLAAAEDLNKTPKEQSAAEIAEEAKAKRQEDETVEEYWQHIYRNVRIIHEQRDVAFAKANASQQSSAPAPASTKNEPPKSIFQKFIGFCKKNKESLRIAGLLLLTIAIIASAILTAGGALAIWGAAGAAAYGISAATAAIFFTTGVTGLTVFAGIPIGVGVSFLLEKFGKWIFQGIKNLRSGSEEKAPLLEKSTDSNPEQSTNPNAFTQAEIQGATYSRGLVKPLPNPVSGIAEVDDAERLKISAAALKAQGINNSTSVTQQNNDEKQSKPPTFKNSSSSSDDS